MEKNLLLVDDEPSILRALKRIFYRAGYTVTLANGPEEALAILEERSFPVVLSDYRMPNKTGGELLIEIKKRWPSTLGLILSGYADLQSVMAALNSGAVYKFLEKPWGEAKLLEEIDNAFAHWHQENALHPEAVETVSAKVNIDDQGMITHTEEGCESLFQKAAADLIGVKIDEALPLLSAKDVRKLTLSDEVTLELFEPSSGKVICVSSTPIAYKVWEVKLSASALAGVQIKGRGVLEKVSVMDNLEQKIAIHSAFSLVYLDIRHFKHFNDCLGYQKSDELLHHITSMFQENLTAGVELNIMNGATFVFFVPKALSPEAAFDFITSLLSPFKQLIHFDQRELLLTFSAGYSVCPEDSGTAEELIRCAQIAANYGKKKGLNVFPRYDVSMDTNRDDMLGLQSELCHALERNEFSVYYQPKISLVTGEIIGAEALIRWHHSTKGLISPDQFIPLAELTGLIGPIGEWVLSTASTQSQIWQQEGLSPFIMSVNVSGRQLVENDLAGKVKAVIQQSGLPPERLELEVTETFLMQDIEHSIDVLKQIKDLGVKIAIDDFGTGYSSFNYLTRLPIDTLKVDRSFISELAVGTEKTKLVKNMISMSHDLGMRVVAEGVETIEQLNYLQKMNCDEVQGFYFSPPVTADEFRKLLKNQAWVNLAQPTQPKTH